MIESNSSERDAKIQKLKDEFERDGYEVLLTPGKESLPFDLDDYLPDMIALKANAGLIVEVRTVNTTSSIERFQTIARTVQQHPGWRFLVVTVDDLNVPASSQTMASWAELTTKIGLVRTLMAQGSMEPAILFLWSIYEGAMRKLAIAAAMPIERLPAIKLMNQLYTAGYISVDEFETANRFLEMRNQIAHGLNTVPDGQLLSSFVRIVSDLIQEWKDERTTGAMLDT